MSATTYSFASTARISKDEIVHRLENINISSVGFIGLGRKQTIHPLFLSLDNTSSADMGIPMALNLRLCLPRRVTLYVYDVNNDAIDAFLSRVREFCGIGNGEDVDQWVVKCISSSEIGAKSVSGVHCLLLLPWAEVIVMRFTQDVVFTIVPEGSHVRAVYLDPTDGLLASFTGTSSVPEQVSTHKTFVDCSTIDTATSLQVNASVTALSTQQTTFHFYDAPVSGGTHGALAATLTFMVGAARPSPSDPTSPSADTHFTTILYPLLLSMSSSPNSIIPLGGPSLGLVAKLANNYLGGLITIATSEAMNFGMRAGVDAKVLRDVFRVSSGGSWVNGRW